MPLLALSVNKVPNYTRTGKPEEKVLAPRGQEWPNSALQTLPKAAHIALSEPSEFTTACTGETASTLRSYQQTLLSDTSTTAE